LTALLAGAATLITVWVLHHSYAAADEGVAGRLPVASLNAVVLRAAAEARSLEMPGPPIREEAHPAAQPSAASAAPMAPSKARPRSAAPPRRCSAETVDFGF